MPKPRYNSIRQTALKWGHAWPTVKKWCVAGLVPGVITRGPRYLIPANARPPKVPPLPPEVLAEHKRRRMAGRAVAARSGYRGVYYRKGRWAAIISVAGKPVHIGTYDTREEAARAWDARARGLRGADALLNFPDE